MMKTAFAVSLLLSACFVSGSFAGYSSMEPLEGYGGIVLPGAQRTLLQAEDTCSLFCLRDDTGGANPLDYFLDGTFGTAISFEHCRTLAVQKGYKYMGFFASLYCFGGNDLGPALAVMTRDQSACYYTCAEGQICGGDSATSFYMVGGCAGYSPPPVASSPPPPIGKTYDCVYNKTVANGDRIDPPIHLGNRNHDVNAVTCQTRCDENPKCVAFYYKTTNLCYLFSKWTRWSPQPYKTVVRSCKVVV